MTTFPKEKFDRMVTAWGFSNLHMRLSWEDLNRLPTEIIDLAKLFAKDFTINKDTAFEKLRQGKRLGLFIWSKENGTGKTALVHQIAKDLILHHVGIRKLRYMGGTEMFLELKRTFEPNGGLRESEILSEITQCDVFFLDDFDKLIRWSAYERERATLIFDKRYTQMSPVVITANRSIEQMKIDGLLESHIYSRLKEMCDEIEIKDVTDHRIKLALKSQPPEQKFL